MSQFIGTSMPRGSAGDITRGMFDYTTEVKQNDTTTPVADDGVLVSLTATGKATPATDAPRSTASQFATIARWALMERPGRKTPLSASCAAATLPCVRQVLRRREELSTWTPQTKALQPLRRETPRLFLTASLWARRMTRAWPKSHSTSNRSKKW